jgi:hypothetical protein
MRGCVDVIMYVCGGVFTHKQDEKEVLPSINRQVKDYKEADQKESE